VLLDDVETGRKAESRARSHLLGGEERIEDPVQDLGIDSAAVVLHVHADGQAERLGPDPDRAALADRVRRATVYWIDVDLESGGGLDFERLQPAGRIVRLEQRPCEEVRL